METKTKVIFIVALFFNLLLSENVFAQRYVAYYDYTETNSVTNQVTQDRMSLRIEKGMYSFDSTSERARMLVRDSLIKEGMDAYAVVAKMRTLPRGAKTRIFTDLKDNQLIVYEYLFRYMYYKEPIPLVNWVLEPDEIKMVAKYQSKKAKAHLYGRDWEVYYTEEIPIGAGPWKISGLPGLVTEAYTVDGLFHYTLVGFEQLSDEEAAIVVEPWGSKGVAATEKSKKAVLKDLYLMAINPDALLKREFSNSQMNAKTPEMLRQAADRKKSYQYIEK